MEIVPKKKEKHVLIPAYMVPSWRVGNAFKFGSSNRFLYTAWGGLGDQVCAEPVLRYALKAFNKTELHLAAQHPEMFDHLDFKSVTKTDGTYRAAQEVYDREKEFLIFDTIVPSDHMLWEYVSHCVTHCVDFASISAYRSTLPVADKYILLKHGFCPENPVRGDLAGIDWKNCVVVHAGRHWPSKTFPKIWWDLVIGGILLSGKTPILIGANADDNRGTVNVDSGGCIDLRGKTSIKELIYVLQKCRVLLSNDSFPIHVAASGNAWIGMIASCKHPDYITHWRGPRTEDGELAFGDVRFGWRTQNLGRDGIWNYINHNPSSEDEIQVNILPEGVMDKILPEPNTVVNWALKKLSGGADDNHRTDFISHW